MVQVLSDVSVFLQPTRGKEVPEKVQKKSQQSQEVCALIEYTCVSFNLGNSKLCRKKKGNNIWKVLLIKWLKMTITFTSNVYYLQSETGLALIIPGT